MNFIKVLVVSMLLCGSAVASPTVDTNLNELNRAASVLNRLLSTISDPRQQNISLIIDPSTEVNAYAYFPNVIVVNKGLINNVDDDMLAAVLGHELGHHRFGDVLIPNVMISAASQRFREAKADNYGINIANRAGFDGCGGAKRLFRWFIQLEGPAWSNTPGAEHPSSKSRLDAAIKQCGG